MTKGFQERFLLKRFENPPSEWKMFSLGDIFTERKETSSDITKYPLYSFTIEKGITPKTERYERSFLLKDKDNNEYKLVHYNDLVFNPMNLRFGAIAFSHTQKTVSVSAYYNILSINDSSCNSIFAESLFKSHQMMDLYDRVAIGSLIEKRRVHLSEFVKLKIFLPPLAEQERIAEILGCWDSGIEKVERLIDAKRKLKKGLMQQLLTGKKRFNEFKGQEWEKVYLGDVFKHRNERGNDHLPLLAITGADGITDREDLGRRDTSNTDKSKYLRICPGDIGYNTMRMWQGVNGVSKLEGIVSPAYTICIPEKTTVDSKFMGYLFKFHPVVFLFYRHSQGLVSDTWNLKFHHFAEIKVTIPPLKEQQKIASVLNAADKEIEILKNKLGALKNQKKGLMQKLLTGKIRVKT